MDPVKASPELPLDPAVFIPRFEAAARKAGFQVTTIGEVEGFPLLACTKPAPASTRRVYVSSGTHGDEPAPPWALLRLVERGIFDDRASWYLCPLLNPTGFIGRTRENHAKLDLNRDYKEPKSVEVRNHIAWLRRQPGFDVMFCVHEDWEAKGFYLYELNHENRPTLADVMIEAASMLCPIDPDAVIDGRPISEPGIIRPISDPLLRETWPEAIYLRNHHGTLTYTTETPSSLPLEQRITIHTAVLRAALEAFFKQA